MSTRKHDRSHFYKYASRKTALIVIQNKSFRWSTPLKFNDPFDHQIGFTIGQDIDRFAPLLLDACKRVVFDGASVISSAGKLSQFLLYLRARIAYLPQQEALERLNEMCVGIATSLIEMLDSLNEQLRAQLCHSRVFCVTEKRDNLVMWSHYAEEHQGVVFKLRCVDEIDNTLLAAEPVSYVDSFIPFPSAEDYARHLTGEKPFDMLPLIWQMAFTKHKDWEYEREWRVHLGLTKEPAGDGFATYVEDSNVFEAVYLGCRMPQEDKVAVKSAVRRYLPHVKIYQAILSKRAFGMEFVECVEP